MLPTGHISGLVQQQAGLLARADVCCLPSRYEPFGTVIPESWYAGIPLVATRADGAKHYVTDRKDGCSLILMIVTGLLPRLNPRLRTNPAQATDQGGQATYDELFSRDVVVSQLITSYQDMIRRYRDG